MRKCVVCGEEADVLDTEYDEAYCTKDARVYGVFEGPWRELGDDE